MISIDWPSATGVRRQRLRTPVAEGQSIEIITAVQGG